jgi:hypothetical protein
MVDLETIETSKPVLVSRILGWFGGSHTSTTTTPVGPASEEFDLYAAEEGLFDH